MSGNHDFFVGYDIKDGVLWKTILNLADYELLEAPCKCPFKDTQCEIDCLAFNLHKGSARDQDFAEFCCNRWPENSSGDGTYSISCYILNGEEICDNEKIGVDTW